MKRFFLFAMMCLFGFLGSISAQTTVDLVIGEDGIYGNNNLPTQVYYNYSFTQQIYTAEELNELAGTINSIAFKQYDAAERTRNLSIYLLNTTKDSFQSGSDWVSVTEENMVWTGDVTYPAAAGQWMEIGFQTPFEYTGGNILVCVCDNTGTYKSRTNFYAYEASNRSLSAYRDSSPYDVTNPGVSGGFQGVNNTVKFNITLPADFKPLKVNHNPIALGDRPNGAWMRPVEMVVGTKTADLNIAAIETTNSYFQMSEVELPAVVSGKNTISFDIVHGEAEGNIEGKLAILYNETRYVEMIEMTAFAYTPVATDVWELAEAITSYPFSVTPDMATTYDNYLLPGEAQDGKDVVYVMNFDKDVLLSANVEGENAKVAVYTEDFDGKEGPMEDNNYNGPQVNVRNGAISQMTLPAGKYYIVASSTSEFTLNVDTETILLPEKPSNPSPANMAKDVVNPSLSWDFGAYTVEYQILFGTIYPPQEVYLDWTNNLEVNHLMSDLYNNKNYFWQVNVRNTSGTTYGDVWSFTTSFNVPTNIALTDDELYEGETTTISWDGVEDRSHRGYNVYVNDVKFNKSLITTTSYVLENLPYNMNGNKIYVTAYYDEGESAASSSVYTYVTGMSAVAGNLFEQDGVTPISGGRVVINGTDELGSSVSYTFTADETGAFAGEILAGKYVAAASVDSYQNAEVKFTAKYGETSEVNFMMYEGYYPVKFVKAVPMGDSLVNVTWGQPFNASGVEDFETGDFSSYEWNNEISDYPWVITAEESYEGQYSMKSTCNGVMMGVSAIEVEYSAPASGAISFFYKISSENVYDKCTFYVDGVAKAIMTGEEDWTEMKVRIDAGTHTYKWEYSKDYMTDGGDDVVYIDNITFYTEAEPYTGGWLHYDDGVTVTSFGMGAPEPFYWAVAFPGKDMYKGYTLTKVAMVDYYQNVGECTMYICLGGEDAPGTVVSTQTINFTGVHSFVEYPLETPVTLDGTQTLWIVLYCDELAYPASACNFSGDSNSDWLSLDGSTWGHVSDYNYQYSWTIRGFLENVDGKRMTLGKANDAAKIQGGISTGLVAAKENTTPEFHGLPENNTVTARNIDTRALAAFNVYKRNVNTGDVELIVEKTVDSCYNDASWATQEAGAYQWGVSAIYEGNRGFETYYTEDFESGAMPAGWSTSYYFTYDSYYGAPFVWYVGSIINTGYDFNYSAGDGNYSAFSNKGDYLFGPSYGFASYVTTGMIDIKPNSMLNFLYTAPHTTSYGSQLAVQVATSTSGPWTEVWTSMETTTQNADDWRNAEVSLAEYQGAYYIRFVHRTHPNFGYGGYALGIDNLVLGFDSPESPIVWSKTVDKDMTTEVTVTAQTENGDPVSGTMVTFKNMVEEGYVFSAMMDETGTVTFDSFRKGTYKVTVSKDGFYSNLDGEIVDIWEASQFNAFLTEILAAVEGLYVSPTGWAMWDGVAIGHGEEFLSDFEDGTLSGWVNIDADGDGYMFLSAAEVGLTENDGHNNSYNYAISQSYDNPTYTPLTPDNYLATAKKYYIGEASQLSFWAASMDPRYPSEHFGVAISTTNNTSADSFTTIAEWTLMEDKRLTWYEYTADLSAYAGQEVFIAIRHFDCTDQYILCIDDVELKNAIRSDKSLVSYTVMLDGNIEAENVMFPCYQHENLVDGVEYTTTVVATYSMGESDEVSYTWTKVSEDIFAGVKDFAAVYAGDKVEVTWTLPAEPAKETAKAENETKEGTWAYYDNGQFDDGIGGPASFSWGIKLRAADIASLGTLTKVAAYDRLATAGTFDICLGGDNAPGASVLNQAYTFTASNDFVEIALNEAIDPAGQNVWIIFNTADGANFPAAECTNTGDADGRWITLDGSVWEDVTAYGLDATWMIRGYFEEVEQPEDEIAPIAEILGVIMYRNGELLTNKLFEGTSFTDKNGQIGDEYCVRVVYGGEADSTYYGMSKADCAEAEVVVNCVAPKDLYGVESSANEVTLTLSYNPNPVGEWLYYDNGVNQDGIGGPSSFSWGIMFPAEALAAYEGTYFTKVALFDFAQSEGNINIHYGGTSAPGDLVHSQAYVGTGSGQFVEFELTAALPIESSNVWVIFTTSQGANYPASCSADCGDPNSRWISTDGVTWEDVTAYGIYNTWMIRAYATNARGEVSSLSPIADYEYPSSEGEVKSAGVRATSALKHYNVYRGTSANNMVKVGETTTKTYVEEVENGTYYYQMTAVYEEYGEECESDPANAYGSDEKYVVVGVTAIDENGVNGMMVYPNPTKGALNINVEGMTNITITNALGQVMYDSSVATDNEVIDMAQFEAGVYMVRITTEAGVAVERITVVK